MIAKLISVLILIAGVINVLPVVGLLSKTTLEGLYGISITDPNTEILMRHRAVMFGLIGTFMIIAAFRPTWQIMAIIAGLISMISFILIAIGTGDYSTHITKIIRADIIGSICLLIAGGLLLK